MKDKIGGSFYNFIIFYVIFIFRIYKNFILGVLKVFLVKLESLPCIN